MIKCLWFALIVASLQCCCDACSCMYSHPQEHYCVADFGKIFSLIQIDEYNIFVVFNVFNNYN